MAMKWVREYIYYFGGDANRVTIGGMSAGGQSIQVHLMAPSSWPFFNRAISISGPTGVPLKNAEESGNCSTPSEHRKAIRMTLTNKKFHSTKILQVQLVVVSEKLLFLVNVEFSM